MIYNRLKRLPLGSTIVHGGCRGADIMAARIGHGMGHTHKPCFADWRTHGKAAGPIRNQAMLDEHPEIELVIAFHDDVENSRGTKHMIGLARERGIKVEILP